MDPRFDESFNRSPLNQSKLYHDLLVKIMGTELPDSPAPLAARVSVTAESNNPDIFRIYIIPNQEIGVFKPGRSYYSRSVPALLREHFEDKVACPRISPHLARFFEDIKNGELELFEQDKFERDRDAFFEAIA